MTLHAPTLSYSEQKTRTHPFLSGRLHALRVERPHPDPKGVLPTRVARGYLRVGCFGEFFAHAKEGG